jgi:hypothetical protein
LRDRACILGFPIQAQDPFGIAIAFGCLGGADASLTIAACFPCAKQLTSIMDLPPVPFVEHAGVLWRRRAASDVELSPYCPKCRLPLTTSLRFQYFLCTECRFSSAFKVREIEVVRNQLERALDDSSH